MNWRLLCRTRILSSRRQCGSARAFSTRTCTGRYVLWLTQTGEICLDVLQTQWSPAWTLHSACTAVLALLDAPAPESPLNVDAANLLRTGDAVAYRSLCQMYTRLYAMA